MKRILLPVACALAFAACNKSDETPAATAPPDATAAAVPEVVPPGAPLREPLPDGMEFDFAFNTVYDKVLAAKDGSPRRRVIVEFLQGTVESTSESVRNDLLVVGYRAGKPRDEEGGTRLNYSRKSDGAKVSVLTRPIIDQRVRDPMAKGTVSLSFVPPAAGAQVATP